MVLEQYITIMDFTSGERMAILEGIRERALRLGLTEVVQHAELALTHERATRALDDRWAAKRTGRLYSQRVLEMDSLVDPVLGSIRDIAVAHTKGLPTDDQLVGQVHAMLDDLFPAGLVAVVSLPCVDQVAATEVIVDKLQTTYPTLVSVLGLSQRVMYLAELTVKYRDAVVNDRDLTYAEVKAMRDIGQTMLRELIAMILGQLADSRNPVKVAQRRELLEPVEVETQRVRKRRARRRSRNGDGEVIVDEDPTSPDPDGDDIEDTDPEEQGQEAALEIDGDREMDMDLNSNEELDLGEEAFSEPGSI